ncbi:Splicing factor 3B subunit 1 [Homalodisca vitripennis]|nr:Splicing factor 3B subunit 1 [Homalodisca vitripennis]
MDRDLVHRQTACAAIKHMALGVYGFGCEDALIHLLNHVWPNIFETSPHLVQAFMDSIEGLRVALGPMKILHLEEEEFEEMSKPVSQTRNEDILGLSLPQGKHVEGNFAKLPNPLERFLKMFKPTDGLNVSELLNNIEIMLKIKGETSLSDSEIINMSVGYATGPLYNKMLQFKVNASNFSEVHKGLLDYFVPFGHREALKRDLVTRSQKPGEKLSSYILNVKQNAKLLLCDYSETELTELIKLGISSQRKSCDSQQDLVVVASRLELNPPASREERITRYVTDRSADCRSN